MKQEGKYRSAASMRVALEERLNRVARDKGIDIMRLRHELIKAPDWFGFAEINAPIIPVISQEQQFAEKIHAYTLPRKTPNSRVKDLVDILLLIEGGKLNIARLKNALSKTFAKRKTHVIPSDLPEPPELWNAPFKRMAGLCGITSDLYLAMEKIRQFHKATFFL